MKNTATKNGMKFTTNAGFWSVENGLYEIVIGKCEDDFSASLWFDGSRIMLEAEGYSPSWALHQFTLAARDIPWTDESFFADTIFPMAKNLNDWMNRPTRETYNAR